MKIDTLPFGMYGENSYVLHDHQHILLVDPGCAMQYFKQQIRSQECVDGILLTHGHEDHVKAVDELYDQYRCPVYLHPDDFFMAQSKEKTYGYCIPLYCPLTPIRQGIYTIGTFSITVYETPGHTAGSVIYRYSNRLFTGDTLFQGSIGRTDLPGGDAVCMQRSLDFIKTLDNDLWIYPGHGEASTLKQEKLTNLFLVRGVDG